MTPRREGVDARRRIAPEALGSAAFRAAYGIKYACTWGAMYKAIASQPLVVALARAGLIGYFGSGGLEVDEIEAAIRGIQSAIGPGQAFGMNLLPSWDGRDLEDRTVDLYLRCGVRRVEAAAYMQMTPPLVRYRLSGLSVGPRGEIVVPNRILAKVSRPEVATAFMQPPPDRLVRDLCAAGHIRPSEAQMASRVPMAHDICVEADSGGHTDGGVASALMPAMLALRAEIMATHRYPTPIHIGAAGGIGTPHAAAAAFVMGADFVLTGSINQCTVEAGTSEAVKDLLQDMNVHDTTYTIAGDMFEVGSKVQVLKRGSLFAARANKLYAWYQQHASVHDLDEPTRRQVEKFFRCSCADAWQETRAYYARTNPRRLADIEANPKQKLAALFKWYFTHTSRLARRGCPDDNVDYQIHTGPALGAFNQWVKGTPLQSWRQRHVADLAERVMRGTADLLADRLHALLDDEDRASAAIAGAIVSA